MLKFLKSIKLNKFSRFLVLTFCWTILPLLLLEVLMIVLEPYLFKGFYQYDPDLGFRVRPYANQTNRFGFNDQDYPLQKQPGTFRMVVISDSYNWAGGLNGNYTTLLEKKFEQHYGQHQVDVINTGYPGTHTGQQLPLLKKYGLQYHPDLVVLGFFVGNDFLDANPHQKRIIVNDVYFDIDPKKEVIIFGYPILPQSRLLMLIQQKYKVFQELAKAKQAPSSSVSPSPHGVPQSVPANPSPSSSQTPSESQLDFQNQPGILSLETFLNTERGRLEFCNSFGFQTGANLPQINYVLESISKMQEILNANQIKFIVAIYPDEFQVNEKLFNQVLTHFNLKREYYPDVNCQQTILKQYLQTKGIPYVDFLARFKAEQKKQPLYLVQEPHWNAAGNRLAADILFDTLRQMVDEQLKTAK